MKKTKINARGILLFWCLFIGLGAVAGSCGMFVDTSGKAMGMEAMLPYFQKLPFADVLFKNFLFSGFALLIVNGITNLVAAALIIAKKKLGIILGAVFGFTLMLWICIQFYMFEFNFMSTSYFIFGFLQLVTGYCAFVKCKQSEFVFNEEEYKNVGTNKSKLVVFYSRNGYAKKIAYEKAEKSGAEIFELVPTERTSGALGFLWCGRFAMHKWGMNVVSCGEKIENYEHISLVSPIWAFGLSAPMRKFIKENSGKIKSADYTFLHFMKSKFENVAEEIDKTLGITRTDFDSVCCRFGANLNKRKK